jgi:hypothetical protein
MEGPSSEFRAYVAGTAAEITSEDALDDLLGQIDAQLSEDRVTSDPHSDLAAVESWASVASYAVGRFYGPASPWPRNVAGWGKKAAGRLRGIANTLAAILRSIIGSVGATGFSIAVGFPWGVSIALNW